MAVLNKEVLAALADPARPLRATALMALSDADRAAIRMLQASWGGIPVERRRLIVHRLVDIAEDNLEADFRQVLRVFLKDADPEVRATAVEGLWEDDSPALSRELMALLKDDPSAMVRRAAAEALGVVALESAVGALVEERGAAIRSVLLAAHLRAGEDPKVRGAALESVGVYEDEEVRQAIALAYGSAEPILRAKAVAAMGANLDAKWHPVVLRELKSPDPLMRYEAASAAGYMELERAVPKLIELCRDPDLEVRLAGISALGQIGGKAARKCLEYLLKSSDPVVSEQANTALDELLLAANPVTGSLAMDIESIAPEELDKE
jgi:HEAT repeat protein